MSHGYTRKMPVSIWVIWTFGALLPFLNKPFFVWRYLYFASAGSAYVLAWLFCQVIDRAHNRANGHIVPMIGVIAVIILLISSIQAHKRAEAFALYSSGNSHIARGYLEPGAQLLEQALQHDAILVPIDAYLRITTASIVQGESQSELLEDGLKRYPEHTQLTLLLGLSIVFR